MKKGEVIGIGGLQGQGQEELLLAIAGYLPVNRGEILLGNEHVKLRHPVDAIRKGIVLVPGDRNKEGLFLSHSILKNFIFPKVALKETKWFITFKAYQNEASKIVETLSIKTSSVNTEIINLSGGNQQKVVIGKWLPLEPKVLLLSDPAKGVDVQAKMELYEVVKQLAENGTAVVLYASDNDELIRHCDKVLVMYEGEIVELLENNNITEERLITASLRSNIN